MEPELREELVGVFFGAYVLAIWWPAPQDQQYPWRWGIALEGRFLDDLFPPFVRGDRVKILASYNDARTEEEARTRALEQARTLMESLPERWASETLLDEEE